MEEVINSMARVSSHNRTTRSLGDRFNDLAKVPEQRTGFAERDRGIQALLRNSNKFSRIVINLSHRIGFVQIPVISLVIERNIDIDDIAFSQWALVWDTVADDLVDGRADRFWESSVVEGRRVGVTLDTGIVHDFIQFICGNARSDVRCCDIQNLPSQSANGTHFLLLIWGQDPWGLACLLDFRHGFTRDGIVRARYVFWKLSFGREWVPWVQCSSELVIGEGIIDALGEGRELASGFDEVVNDLVSFPSGLKACLTTEERPLNPKFVTCGAL